MFNIFKFFRKKKVESPEHSVGIVELKEASPSKQGKSRRRETIEAIVIAILLALFIRAFVVQAFKIPSGSMENTLLVGDHILVSKFAYGLQVPKLSLIGWSVKRIGGVPVLPIPIMDSAVKPLWGGVERGDVIVFRYPEERERDYIKRVVALPGETVEIKKRVIYIDDVIWNEPFGVHKVSQWTAGDNFGPFTVPRDHVFVMGDNRERSHDSRFWGTVPISDIKGRAFAIYWSRDPSKSWPKGIRSDRLGDGIPSQR
ncbi:MAG: signal peptidase I [Deltaproteobacteria bacterium]|nr:signal peptidase I [Deltaproteobacteria bacterium]